MNTDISPGSVKPRDYLHAVMPHPLQYTLKVRYKLAMCTVILSALAMTNLRFLHGIGIHDLGYKNTSRLFIEKR
jgi:hypothetical protein